MQSLAHLSDEELVTELMACCLDARRSKVRTLMFLAEVEERRIHLLAAASSMWDYARRFLRMSHGTAYRHIAGARLCRRFPFLLERIERGELHLTALAQIASVLTEDNVHELVDETKGKSRTEIDLVLRKWFGVEPGRGSGNPLPYDEELLAMVRRAEELLSHSFPNCDRLAISKLAYGVFIQYLERGKRAKADNPRPAPTEPTKSISRHATREMFEEHGDQCCYVDERTGARCPSRAFIQRDHRHMQAHGGTHEAKNLRPLCGPHNRLLAELALGREYVQSRIHCRQQKRR
jgi:hypothetical protein